MLAAVLMRKAQLPEKHCEVSPHTDKAFSKIAGVAADANRQKTEEIMSVDGGGRSWALHAADPGTPAGCAARLPAQRRAARASLPPLPARRSERVEPASCLPHFQPLTRSCPSHPPPRSSIPCRSCPTARCTAPERQGLAPGPPPAPRASSR